MLGGGADWRKYKVNTLLITTLLGNEQKDNSQSADAERLGVTSHSSSESETEHRKTFYSSSQEVRQLGQKTNKLTTLFSYVATDTRASSS